MLDNVKQWFHEGFPVSPEERDKIQQRWNVWYGSAEDIKSSLEVEFSPDIGQPQAAPKQRPVDAASLAHNVRSLEAYREQKEQQQELQKLVTEDREVAKAQLMVEEALDEFAA